MIPPGPDLITVEFDCNDIVADLEAGKEQG